jgi:hypothetical protein
MKIGEGERVRPHEEHETTPQPFSRRKEERQNRRRED